MKQSHYTTPRTLNDAEFQYWGEAFHYDTDHQSDQEDRLVLWASITAVLALGMIVVMGWLA